MTTDANEISRGLSRLNRGVRGYAVVMGGLAVYFGASYFMCSPSYCGRGVARALGIAGLTTMIFSSIYFSIVTIKRDAATVFVPAVVFPLGTALFFGFGSLSTYFANSATLSFFAYGTYTIGPFGLLQTSFLAVTGTTIVLLSMSLVMRMRLGAPRTNYGQKEGAALSTEMTAIVFIVGGAILKYGLILPEHWGIANYTLPGSLKIIGQLIDLGFAAAAFLAARGNKSWKAIFWVLWPIHLGFTTLEFSKKALVLTILLPALGAFLAHRRWQRLIPWVLATAFSFSVAQDVNSTARFTILQRTGTIGDAGLSERIQLLRQIGGGEITLAKAASAAKTEMQLWWVRLNYSGQQLQAMNLYNNGIRGEWTLSFAEAFVPRFLWPNKPEAVSQGRIFNQISTGRSDATTRVGMSIYADGYWQLGWVGTLLFSALAGAIMGFVTRVTYRVAAMRQLVYFPLVLIGIRMAALGPTGYFQKGFAGVLPIFLGYMLLVNLIEHISRVLSRPTARQQAFRAPTGQPGVR